MATMSGPGTGKGEQMERRGRVLACVFNVQVLEDGGRGNSGCCKAPE